MTKPKLICIWKIDKSRYDEDESWDTSCGQKFIFTTGGPKDNEMVYCCYCGKELKEQK